MIHEIHGSMDDIRKRIEGSDTDLAAQYLAYIRAVHPLPVSLLTVCETDLERE